MKYLNTIIIHIIQESYILSSLVVDTLFFLFSRSLRKNYSYQKWKNGENVLYNIIGSATVSIIFGFKWR